MSPTIYALCDPYPCGPPVIRYVGFTTKDVSRRLNEHVGESNYHRKSHRHKWVRSLTTRGLRPVILILDVVTMDNWCERERYWIARLRHFPLVNGTDGGEGLINPSADVLARISAKVSRGLRGNTRRRGKKASAADRAAMSAASKASAKVKAYNESRRGLPVPHLNTSAAKANHRKAVTGVKRPWSREGALRMTENNRGTFWINDGLKMRRLKPGSAIPSGWTEGLLFSQSAIQKRSASIRKTYANMSTEQRAKVFAYRKGRRTINDGKVNKYLFNDQPVPQGWIIGFLRKAS